MLTGCKHKNLVFQSSVSRPYYTQLRRFSDRNIENCVSLSSVITTLFMTSLWTSLKSELNLPDGKQETNGTDFDVNGTPHTVI